MRFSRGAARKLLGFRVSGCRVSESRVWGLGFQGLRVKGVWCRVKGVGCRV